MTPTTHTTPRTPRTSLMLTATLAVTLAACAQKPAPRPAAPIAVPAAVLLAPQPVIPAAPNQPFFASDRVHTGQIVCELGQIITVEESPAQSGQYTVAGKGFKYLMQRVPTTTGAVRLEDKNAGAVWLQIANKSMLMNQKQGRRVADECRSPAQQALTEQLRNHPQMGNLFDAPKR